MARKLITAKDALRAAYAVRWTSEELARDYAVALMVKSGHDRDIAEAAVIAAHASFAITRAV